MTTPTAPIDVAVVDDNALIGQTVERWMDGHPVYRCVGAYRTTEAALEGVVAHPPAVLLVDVDMPGSDPFDLLTQLARRAPQVKVVMFSGHPKPEYIARALDNGAAGYIVKDEGMGTIMEFIRRAAGGEVVLSNTAKGALMSRRR